MGFGKDGTGVIITELDDITLLTLGVAAVVKQDTPLPITEDFRMLKSVHHWSLTGATTVSGDGPLVMGIANDSLSAAEIVAALIADGPLDRSDRVKQELAERGVFAFDMDLISFDVSTASVNGSRVSGVVTNTQRWTYSSAVGWSLWIFNLGTGALTTGGVVRVLSKYFGVWLQ